MNGSNSRKSGKGFTLIELLIVVAIIAILAAIAVPNFLEAQTRAKISRFKADARSMATAMESYAVDYNNYPSHFASDGPRLIGPISAGVALSTPVAYITNPQIKDVFGSKLDERDVASLMQFAVGHDGSYAQAKNKPYNSNGYNGQGCFPNNCYAIISIGPNKRDDTRAADYPYVNGKKIYARILIKIKKFK